MRKTAVVLAFLSALSAHASSPDLVFDINDGTRAEGSHPSQFFSVGQRAYFFANDGSGAELWITDGTAAGTRMVADLTPGTEPEYPDFAGFTKSGDLVWFWRSDPFDDDHTELWRTDGTRNGTFAVADLDGGPGELVAFGARGVIAHTSYSFVVSDGTVDGTTFLEDETPFYLGSLDPHFLVSFRGTPYFVDYDSLWRTDGTASGTTKIGTFREDFDGAMGVVAADDAIYIAADSDSDWDTYSVFRSDGGTPALVATFKASDPPRLVVNDGVAYALVSVGELTEIWRLGTTPQRMTVIAGDIDYGTFLEAKDGAIWFATSKPNVLWRSDGTAAGTRVFEGVDVFEPLIIAHGRVFALTSNGVFVSDGTQTTKLSPFGAGAYEAAAVGDRVVLSIHDDVHGDEPWVTDGTESGTRLLKNIRADGGSGGAYLRRIGDQLMFSAFTERDGREPWITDGTLWGTRLLADIVRGDSGSFPSAITRLPNGKTVFAAARKLYATDGNLTEMLRITGDDVSVLAAFAGRGFPVINGRAWLLFDTGFGDELWATDGTKSGTTKLMMLPRRLSTGAFAATSRLIFYAAGDGLWRSDGTQGGTFSLASYPEQIVAAGEKVFFVSQTAAHGRELWVTDGTLGGTHVVKDIHPGEDGAFPFHFAYDDHPNLIAAAGNVLFFAADDGAHGLEPWRSDGTESGTFLLRDVAPGEASSMLPMFEDELTAFAGSSLFFLADDGEHGFELWRSDLQTAELARDICPGLCSSSPTHLRAIGDDVFFSADDGRNGRELWSASANAVRFIADVNDGPDSSHPREMTALDGAIYFFATTEQKGDELWRVEVPNPRRRAVR